MTPLENAKQRFNGKNILVFGLGLLGGAVGDVRFLSKLGAHIRITDAKSATELASSIAALNDFSPEYTFGTPDPSDITWADYILRNPSVPQTHPMLIMARELHKPILMRSSLFAELAGIPVIGITGTRGKTTTTMMIYEIARQLSPQKVLLGGNIAGVSDLELLEQIDNPAQYLAVMELSSWQLQGFAQQHIAPHIAVITNLFPDHLNAYSDLATYYQDKKIILEYQSKQDLAVLNINQPEFHDWATTVKGIIHWVSSDQLPHTCQLRVPGEHNRQNAAAALEVGRILGFTDDAMIKILNTFDGVPYRLQLVAQKRGISFINDTTATTPTAGTIALAACQIPPILICGGADKQLPLESYAQALNRQTKTIILLAGTGTERLKPLLDPQKVLAEVHSMPEALNQALTKAMPGDTVLLSPGFASFGLFNNEFDRGDQFNQCVNALP